MTTSEIVAIKQDDKEKYKKVDKLIDIAQSVLYSKEHKQLCEHFYQIFHTTEDKVIQAFIDYNLNIYAPEGNEIYSSIENRIVLYLHNFIVGSWHQERQQVILDFLKLIKAKKIADIGFGVPSRYVKEYVLDNEHIELSFCDKFDSAFLFAEQVCRHWDPYFDNKIRFVQTDFNSLNYVGNFEAYIFQDTLEHAIDSRRLLFNYVKRSPADAKFLLSLPIGPIFPRHYIAWLSDNEAMAWVESVGLKPIETRIVYVKLEVDVFADTLTDNYHDFYILAGKS